MSRTPYDRLEEVVCGTPDQESVSNGVSIATCPSEPGNMIKKDHPIARRAQRPNSQRFSQASTRSQVSSYQTSPEGTKSEYEDALPVPPKSSHRNSRVALPDHSRNRGYQIVGDVLRGAPDGEGFGDTFEGVDLTSLDGSIFGSRRHVGLPPLPRKSSRRQSWFEDKLRQDSRDSALSDVPLNHTISTSDGSNDETLKSCEGVQLRLSPKQISPEQPHDHVDFADRSQRERQRAEDALNGYKVQALQDRRPTPYHHPLIRADSCDSSEPEPGHVQLQSRRPVQYIHPYMPAVSDIQSWPESVREGLSRFSSDSEDAEYESDSTTDDDATAVHLSESAPERLSTDAQPRQLDQISAQPRKKQADLHAWLSRFAITTGPTDRQHMALDGRLYDLQTAKTTQDQVKSLDDAFLQDLMHLHPAIRMEAFKRGLHVPADIGDDGIAVVDGNVCEEDRRTKAIYRLETLEQLLTADASRSQSVDT